jgi:hypothetical protein
MAVWHEWDGNAETMTPSLQMMIVEVLEITIGFLKNLIEECGSTDIEYKLSDDLPLMYTLSLSDLSNDLGYVQGLIKTVSDICPQS